MASEKENGLLEEILEDVKTIKKVIIGDISDPKQPGLVERVRTIEKWIEKREWYEKILIVAVTVEAIGLGFVLLKTLVGI